MIYDLEDKKREEVRQASPGALTQAIPSAVPEMAFLHEKPRIPFRLMWYSGVLVFWYSGLAPRKTRFWDTGTLCTWHVACGGLDFQGKNAGGSWHLAKRSPGPGRQTSAGLSAGLSVTNPIPAGRHPPPFYYVIVPRFQSDADCAKRSQFLDCGFRIADWAQTCGETPRGACRSKSRLCKTKPIPAGRDAACGSGFPSRPSGLPVNCAKQTQFQQRERRGKYFAGKDLW